MDTKKLRQKVLDLAIHGKLVRQDSNDEPASILLDRIRAEKAQLVKEGKIKNTTSTTKNSENKPYDIPESWTWCIVDDFAYVASGSTPQKEAFVDKGIPYIKMYNIRNQKIDFEFQPQYIKEEIHNGKLKRSRTEVGDLLMNIVGPPLGKMAIIPPSLPESNFNQAAVLIRPLLHKEILVKYLFYYLSEMSEINSISTKGTAGQVNISLTQSQNMRVALPPLDEQRRIVKAVDELFEQIDIIERSEKELEEAANKTRDKLLNLAIQGHLVPQDPNEESASVLLERIRAEKVRLVKEGKLKKKDLEEKPISPDEIPFDIPEGWVWCRLGDIFLHSSGKQLSGSNKEGTLHQYITTSNLYWGRFELDNLKSMYYKDSELEKCTAIKGDLLVCEGGDIGRSAIWPYDYDICLQNHVHRLRPFDNGYTKFVYYIMMLYKSLDMIGGRGIAIQGLSASALKSIIIPLPPLSEQRRIVTKLEELLQEIDKLKA